MSSKSIIRTGKQTQIATGELPGISIIIPTYNSEGIIGLCLKSIRQQCYPQNKIEILIIDGGSSDQTINIAEKYNTVIFNNKFVIHPKGRPIGIKKSHNDLLLFLDSDNIIIDENWLKLMVLPFKDKSIVAAAPFYYLFESKDNLITKYCALLGGDDPVVVYLGINDSYSFLTNKWCDVPKDCVDMGSYFKVKFLDPDDIPSLGANGCMIRKSVLKKVIYDPFHHVTVSHDIIRTGGNIWAKVKTGLIHRQGNNIFRFINKKIRRIERRLDSKSKITYMYKIKPQRILMLILKSILIVPIFVDAFLGYLRKKSSAWLLHPILFYLVFFTYIYLITLRKFSKAGNEYYERI